MILRRLSTSLKEQNWMAIGIEFVLLVVGVFLGIQVANWNVERSERIAETGYLAGLQKDVDYSIGSLQNMIQSMERQQAARKKLYFFATDPDATLMPEERDQLLLSGLFYLAQIDINTVTFETLKSSGRMSVIHSPLLESELQSLDTNVATALRDQADEVQTTYLFSDPLLVKNIDMAGVFRQPNRAAGRSNISWLKDATSDASMPQVIKSREFANVLLYRSFFTDSRLRGARNMLAQHQRIAALIKARQSVLGATP
jgi:hypothetical protein